jgi:hypothetical protein
MRRGVYSSGQDRGRIGSARWTALLGLALFAIGLHRARAEQPTAEAAGPAPMRPGLQILAAPYLWFPWTSISVRPANPRIPSASAVIDPGTLYDHLTWVPLTGQAEIRRDQFGLMLDYIHLPVKSSINTRNILFGNGSASSASEIGTAMFLYRPIVGPDRYLDVGAGVRAWGIGGSISLHGGLLPPTIVSNGLSWADPLIGVRYHRALGSRYGVTAYGDFGGFGLGAHTDWQLLGTIDYEISSRAEMHMGFRSLNYNYGARLADFNVHIYGPIVSVTFRF